MDVVGVSALLAPAALDCVPRHLGVVSGNNGVSGRFLGGESNKKQIIFQNIVFNWYLILFSFINIQVSPHLKDEDVTFLTFCFATFLYSVDGKEVL